MIRTALELCAGYIDIVDMDKYCSNLESWLENKEPDFYEDNDRLCDIIDSIHREISEWLAQYSGNPLHCALGYVAFHEMAVVRGYKALEGLFYTETVILYMHYQRTSEEEAIAWVDDLEASFKINQDYVLARLSDRV